MQGGLHDQLVAWCCGGGIWITMLCLECRQATLFAEGGGPDKISTNPTNFTSATERQCARLAGSSPKMPHTRL